MGLETAFELAFFKVRAAEVLDLFSEAQPLLEAATECYDEVISHAGRAAKRTARGNEVGTKPVNDE
jgi:hypothetical protein